VVRGGHTTCTCNRLLPAAYFGTAVDLQLLPIKQQCFHFLYGVLLSIKLLMQCFTFRTISNTQMNRLTARCSVRRSRLQRTPGLASITREAKYHSLHADITYEYAFANHLATTFSRFFTVRTPESQNLNEHCVDICKWYVR
jgi:hypothetical protein